MARYDYEFMGFLFNDTHDAIDNPCGAFLTRTPYKNNLRLSDVEVEPVPMNTFKEYVANNAIQGIGLKDDKLYLRALRKGLRDTKVDNAISDGAVLGSAAIATNIAASAGAVTTTAVISEGAALTAGAASGSTALMATGAAVAPEVVAAEVVGVTAASSVFPAIVLAGAIFAISTGAIALHGALTSSNLYSYTKLRMISKHVELASENEKCIALSLMGISKKKGNTVTFAAYGKGLKSWVKTLIEDNPNLPGSIATPTANITMLNIPYDSIMNNGISCGYNLLYNTQLISDDSYIMEISKKLEIENRQLEELCNKLNTITNTSLSEIPNGISTESKDNVVAYCKKMGITEEYFWESEAPRLITLLGSSKENISRDLSVLL